MAYYNVTVKTLYESCKSASWDFNSGKSESLINARAWVEAENVFELWRIINKWFDYMQAGTVLNQLPNPLWSDATPDKRPLNMMLVDDFIEELDADFQLEKNRFKDKMGPDFFRLPPLQRMAFVQECYRIMKTESMIHEEAERRLAEGEKMPPKVTT